ncbi:hypothetical protein GYA54_02120 [Candidatus Kuenenbacteria bacterium]|nr:hypothetical protein [Candidatus Kuenenbacteria bacterium]
MKISKAHGTTQAEAIAQIDRFLDGLMSQAFPGGVTIKDPTKLWQGNIMSFSFRARKGLFGTVIAGEVTVDDQNVTLNCEVPALVTSFVPEEKIAGVINRQFDQLFT